MSAHKLMNVRPVFVGVPKNKRIPLRLRKCKRTVCAFVDVRKAFDVAWRDAVLVKLAESGITGSTWNVLDDLLTGTSAKVFVNGALSEPWAEAAGVRQGNVLGPLLFNVLFNGIASAVRGACPGVALGGPGSPRVTLLLYADDLVVLAESCEELQRALDAIGAWGARWRFSFGIGPDKTAVLVVGCRSPNFNFTLQGSQMPVVSEYRYLGVIFQSSQEWNKHADHLCEKSPRKFYQCLAWAETVACASDSAAVCSTHMCCRLCCMGPNSSAQVPSPLWIKSCDTGVAAYCSGLLGLPARRF